MGAQGAGLGRRGSHVVSGAGRDAALDASMSPLARIAASVSSCRSRQQAHAEFYLFHGAHRQRAVEP
jgi:hypothetical protein